ncbi:PadR family transcriptional regulator [Flavilitoribacter nigricans]|uniref:PadR family transcriptional regulator n=1 Tax=Flavilitoribacter nigricans (strain ATCC 23147 / DSM 23189 / NBRC 102662 / NCIMB 1420 / SS-2) TaxID=1122177 RepID=A0A2D0NAK6_FLAN2|nr:PadR family transcriptional regulator [Flavilitoribacter nigricans]PHN05418.1 PadR family transcriptional regulator [Flavilitoribacter nigricans DSM 23189 = NBRC 102662]
MANNKLYKGSLSTIILRLLEENERMYGYEICQKVKELTDGELIVTEGALYPALHKLEGDGFLRVEYQEVDGRTRKYYLLTESGLKETAHKMDELQAFVQQMQQLLDLKPGIG